MRKPLANPLNVVRSTDALRKRERSAHLKGGAKSKSLQCAVSRAVGNMPCFHRASGVLGNTARNEGGRRPASNSSGDSGKQSHKSSSMDGLPRRGFARKKSGIGRNE